MPDIALVKTNIGRMIDQGAPEADIDAYIAAEGVSPNDLKVSRPDDVRSDVGASFTARAAEGLAVNPEDKLATVQGYYPGAERDVVDPENYVIQDTKTGEQRLFNKPGFDFGDVTALGRPAAEMAGGTAGAVAGAATPVPGGTAAGAGLGAAAGGEIATEAGRRFLDVVDTRGTGERALDAGLTGALSAGGQQAGELIGQGVRAGAKSLFRGVGPEAIAGNLAAYEATGAVKSTGQVLQRRWVQSLESWLSGIPGGSGRFHKKAVETADNIGQFIEQRAYRSSGVGLEPERAGRVIQRGIEDFTGRFRDRSEVLFGKLDEFIPSDTLAVTANTKLALDKIAGSIEGAKALSQTRLFSNPTARELSEALAVDANARGSIPYGMLREMRSRVGRKLANPSLVEDLPRGELKQLYAAISSDLENAASFAGPKAVKAFGRANNFYRSGIKRIDDFLDPLEGRVIPEKVFRALEVGGKDGATQLRAVRKSLKPEQWKVVAGTVMRRLGKATPGAQDEAGEVFSVKTFLTNWNRLSNEAKDALFSGPQMGGMRKDHDTVARVASRAVESGNAFANPSGTSGASIGKGIIYGGIGGGAAGLMAGETGAALFLGGLVAGGIGSNLLARLMTNPRFVQWAAAGTRVKPAGVAAHLGRLTAVARGADPETREAVQQYVRAFTTPTEPSPERTLPQEDSSAVQAGAGG